MENVSFINAQREYSYLDKCMTVDVAHAQIIHLKERLVAHNMIN